MEVNAHAMDMLQTVEFLILVTTHASVNIILVVSSVIHVAPCIIREGKFNQNMSHLTL